MTCKAWISCNSIFIKPTFPVCGVRAKKSWSSKGNNFYTVVLQLINHMWSEPWQNCQEAKSCRITSININLSIRGFDTLEHIIKTLKPVRYWSFIGWLLLSAVLCVEWPYDFHMGCPACKWNTRTPSNLSVTVQVHSAFLSWLKEWWQDNNPLVFF